MIFLYYLAALIIGYFLLRRLILEHFYISQQGQFVFITGCDSGFGRLLAIRLLSQGVNVFAGCYTPNGGESLRKWLTENRTKTSGELYPVTVDITNDASVAAAKTQVENVLKEKGGDLHAVVNNAGVFTTFGPDDWCTIAEFQMSLNVNTLGTVRVCHAFKSLIKRSKGRIVTMGSTAGRLHGKFVAPYVTAKFAVEAYMDCLRLEMRPFGVTVHILEPGAFKTELLNEDAQHARINRIWSGLSDDVKNEYGETYLENFKVAWQSGVNAVANTNLQWVVSSYEHALFAVWPRLRYGPGWDAIFCFIPLSVVPTFFQDTVLDFMYSMQPGPPLNPAALIKNPVKSPFWASLTAVGNHLGVISFVLALISAKATTFFGHQNPVSAANVTVKDD